MICYVQSEWRPRIRPGAVERQWMGDTPESYAYRCLPLSIANAHGWEILSPCTFRVRWHGGVEAASLELDLSKAELANFVPQSLFGSGIMTIHIEGLIQTEPGWNLWVSGPPNAPKDGIAPLTGIIETDWSPYTFTMNWKLTRPGHWVEFEENEPICFFFPVRRGEVARVEPSIQPISESDGLDRQFRQWADSRLEFHRQMARQLPENPSDRWQKLYYRGLRPDGSQGVEDHEVKLRVQPFRENAGDSK